MQPPHRRPADCDSLVRVLEFIAPRNLHRRLAARLDGVTAGAEPDLTRTVVLLDSRQAKGLEFHTVFVIWLTDGMFPSARSRRCAVVHDSLRPTKSN